jgi:hypothetical protein
MHGALKLPMTMTVGDIQTASQFYFWSCFLFSLVLDFLFLSMLANWLLLFYQI